MTTITLRCTNSGADQIYNMLANLDWDAGNTEVVIREHKEKRSLEQNALWHRQIGQIAAHMGYDPKQMKDIIKYALNYYDKIPCKVTEDNPSGYIMSFHETHKFSVEQLTLLIDHTIVWAAEHGVIL